MNVNESTRIALTVLLIAASSNTLAGSPEWNMVNVNTSKQGDAHLLIDSGVNTRIDVGSPSQAKSQLVPFSGAWNSDNPSPIYIAPSHRPVLRIRYPA